MIVQHRAILDASDRRQPWAENCMVTAAMDPRGNPLSRTMCLDLAFLSGKRYKVCKTANNAILKMMGK